MLTSRRVLLLAETCAGGVGRHVLDLTEGLAELGHEVHLLYSPLRSDAVVSTRIPLLAAGARNIRIRPMRIQRLPHASDLAACWALRQYLRAHGPFDVIHSHGTKAGLLGRAGVLGNPAVRVYTPHCSNTLNPHLTVLERKILAGMENVLAMIGDGVIAVSTEEYEHLRTLGIPDSKVFLVPNGIRVAACDMAREEKRRKLGLSADAVCVGFVGRLVREKSLEVLLQAFALLLPEISGSTRLAVVGDGPLSAKLRNCADSLGIAGQVLWLGEQDGPALMPAFDIFAMSSSCEGLPYVLLEAMAAGLPLVTTRVGGVRLLIDEGQNGNTVPAGRPELLADALRPLILNGELRKHMGQKSRTKVKRFSLEAMVSQTVSVYEQLLLRRCSYLQAASTVKGR